MMLKYIKEESNKTLTENGAATFESTNSHCLDLFAAIGALRGEAEEDIIERFLRAYAEDRDMAMKILFFGRDVRGGLGERRVFRVIVNWLADHEPESLRKNITLIPEYGRFDDLLALLGTACEDDAIKVIREQLADDWGRLKKRDGLKKNTLQFNHEPARLNEELVSGEEVSLLAKWLPSVNASNPETVRMAKHIARRLGMTDAQYRKVLVELRRKISIIENHLREKEYSFDYAKQPSKALFKYRKAFARNDGARYGEFLNRVENGVYVMHTGALMPYDIIAPCFNEWYLERCLTEAERKTMDVTWNALENYGTDENALVVIDGSGSMYFGGRPKPMAVALSLGIYFAERNTGIFRNHFITFSATPRLVEIKGKDIAEKVRYCAGYNEVANTNLQAVFDLVLNAAVKNCVKQEDMPKKIYIVSDMEFDCCINNADSTNFACAKKRFEAHGYRLPDIVFWNVASRNKQQPVTLNETGVALVSGCTQRLFSMVAGGVASPYTVMKDVIGSERYAGISA